MTKIEIPVDPYVVINDTLMEDQFQGTGLVRPANDELGLHLHVQLGHWEGNINLTPDQMEDLIYHMQCAIEAHRAGKEYHPLTV